MITVPYWWHASLLEVLWLAGGVIALPLALRNLRDANEEVEAVAELRDDEKLHSRHFLMLWVATRGQSLDHWLTVVVSCLIVIAGIVGCTVANPLGGRTTVTGLAITFCLLGVSAATAVRAFSARSIRSHLYELAAGRSSVIAAEMRARAIAGVTDPSKKEEA